jgi:DNA-binding transcriptional LysR family regulator
MKLDPRHLVQLATILDAGTLRVAAERLGTTQPALSRTIAMMEERIGTPLFERRRRPLTPTDTGIELAAFGRTIRGAVEQADRMSHQITSGDYGTIRVGAPPFMCDQLISRIIGGFTRARPQVRVVLHGDYFPALVTALNNHRLDMVIGPFELLERPTGLAIERILKNRNVIVCRSGHKLTRRKKVTAADFEQALWAGHSRQSVLSADLRATLADLGVDQLNVAFESDSAGAVLTLVRDGDYLTVLPLLSVAQRVVAGELATLPTPRGGPERWTAIITRADSAQNAAMTELKKVLAREITAIVPLMNKLAEPGDRLGASRPSRAAPKSGGSRLAGRVWHR